MASTQQAEAVIAPAQSESRRLFDEARRWIPGGTSRVHYFFEPHPIYARSARGCRLTDVDGVERLDFLNNMTALVHGHAHPAITAAVVAQMERGASWSEPGEAEIALARLLVDRVASLERIRFATSGTDAVMLAIKLAREFTGRSRIAKFEGFYHGYYDYTQVSVKTAPGNWGPADAPHSVANTGGLAAGVLDDVVSVPFNDLEVLERLLDRHGATLSAFILDPLAGQSGSPVPHPGFLDAVVERCHRHGIVVIYDEVVSFRVARGGAQARYGGRPDLTCFGKVIGGGLPIGAVGGREDIMTLLDPSRGAPKVLSGGTFSANPVSMVAGLACMELLTPEEYARLDAMGARLRREVDEVFVAAGERMRAGGDASLFRINPTDDPVTDYRAWVRNAQPASRMAALHRHLMDEGIIIAKMGTACLSTPMGDAEVDAFVRALERAVAKLRA